RTVYNWGSYFRLMGVRLPGNPTGGVTGGGYTPADLFWTQTFTYNSDGDVLTRTTNVLNAAQTAVSETRTTDYEYAHGRHRVTRKRIKTDTAPNYRVTEYFYDGD